MRRESVESQVEYPLEIVIDHREVHSGVVEALEEYFDLRLEIAALPKGDYWIGAQIAVERKTVPDMVRSIVDNERRLFNQVRGIKALGMRPIFVVEGGSLYDVLSPMNEATIIEALSYLAVVESVTVLRSEGPEDTGRLLYAMARHAQMGLGFEVPLRRHHVRSDLSREQQYLVEGLPGVGPRLARALLTHFGSARAVFSADAQVLQSVIGVGRARAAAIQALLDAPYSPLRDYSPDDESMS